MQVFGLVADLATDQGIHDFENDDEARDGALAGAANALQNMESEAGMLDPEETSSDFDALIQADRDGSLAQILGGGAQNG
jgi:hypothetical protein